MEFVDYKCLESLLIEGEGIALEGIFSKLKKTTSGPKLPEGMSYVTALHKYIDGKKLYNKSESETTYNAYGGQSYEKIINEKKDDPGRYMAGIDWVVHTYQSPESKYPTWIVVCIDMNKDIPTDFIIPYIKKNDVKFSLKEVITYINNLPEYK